MIIQNGEYQLYGVTLNISDDYVEIQNSSTLLSECNEKLVLLDLFIKFGRRVYISYCSSYWMSKDLSRKDSENLRSFDTSLTVTLLYSQEGYSVLVEKKSCE